MSIDRTLLDIHRLDDTNLCSLDRLGIFYFVPFLGDTVLKPIDHPSIRKFGSKDFFEEYYELGGKPIIAEGAPPLFLSLRLVG